MKKVSIKTHVNILREALLCGAFPGVDHGVYQTDTDELKS